MREEPIMVCALCQRMGRVHVLDPALQPPPGETWDYGEWWKLNHPEPSAEELEAATKAMESSALMKLIRKGRE